MSFRPVESDPTAPVAPFERGRTVAEPAWKLNGAESSDADGPACRARPAVCFSTNVRAGFDTRKTAVAAVLPRLRVAADAAEQT